jgi:hypothetical protein
MVNFDKNTDLLYKMQLINVHLINVLNILLLKVPFCNKIK